MLGTVCMYCVFVCIEICQQKICFFFIREEDACHDHSYAHENTHTSMFVCVRSTVMMYLEYILRGVA